MSDIKVGDFISYQPFPDSEKRVIGKVVGELTEGDTRYFMVKTPPGLTKVNSAICKLKPKICRR